MLAVFMILDEQKAWKIVRSLVIGYIDEESYMLDDGTSDEDPRKAEIGEDYEGQNGRGEISHTTHDAADISEGTEVTRAKLAISTRVSLAAANPVVRCQSPGSDNEASRLISKIPA